MIHILLAIVGIIGTCAVFHAYTESLLDPREVAQQKALRRHRKAQERDRKRAEAYWRERGKRIRPGVSADL